MKPNMTASEFDRIFDEGKEDVIQYGKIITQQKTHRINSDIPVWIVDKLDHESKRLGISRRAVINLWLADKASMI